MKHAELALSKAGAVSPSPFDFSGHWVNELTSYMDLTVNGAIVTGSYTSAVSSSGGPTTMPLSGTVTGDLITFVVNWGTSITAWVGHGVLSNGRPQILTLWHLVITIDDETNPGQQWKTVMAGADEFKR
jgi:hypothetical protein